MENVSSTQVDSDISVLIKFILCVLLTQFGKTFTVIERIFTEIHKDTELGRSIHIVFTMNTLLNSKQFAKRLKGIEEAYGKGSVCILASNYTGDYVHVKNLDELLGTCVRKCPRVVVMCSNSRRYDDGVEFLKIINNNGTMIRRAFAYYDELHEYINDKVRVQIEEIHELDIVKGIIALTASPKNIWKETISKFWSNIRLIHFDHFNDSNYAGYSDMIFNCIDDFGLFQIPYSRPGPFEYAQLDRENIGFIKHVLELNPEILCDGSRSFIPAHKRRLGHNDVRDLIFEKRPDAVVVVLNGVEKTLRYKENGKEKTIPLSSNDDEVCETIAKIIARIKLQDRPLVITGLLCVGMGQTLTHQLIGSFTSAIFGHMDLTNEQMYQLFGRITGRMKAWPTYCQTQVYCPTVIMQRCYAMEECAKIMATKHNGEVVTEDDYTKPMIEMGEIGESAIQNIRKQKETKKKVKAVDTDRDHKIFETQEKARQYANKELGHNLRQNRSIKAPATLLENKQNPTEAQILERWWGTSKKTPVRMVPTFEGKWCLYWRPSLKKEKKKNLIVEEDSESESENVDM